MRLQHTLLVSSTALLMLSCATLKAATKCNVPESVDPVGKEKYTVLLYGDFGASSSPTAPNYVVGKAMAQVCSVRGCDFALGLGDNFYDAGVSSVSDPQFQTKFEIPYKDLNFPHYQSLGNHDYGGNVQAQIDYRSDKWKMLCAYYPVPNLPPWLTIFALDTNKLNTDQYDQLKAATCGKDGWKIVYGHHPMYSNGEHGDTGGSMSSKILPIMKQCGIQFIVSGHDHDQEHISSASVEQIVQGAAGKLRSIPTGVQRPGLTQRFATSTYGFGVLEVTRNALTVDFYNDKGAVIYHFTKTR